MLNANEASLTFSSSYFLMTANINLYVISPEILRCSQDDKETILIS
jgi:hypothetical protein